jgi:DNA-binding MarR family transcriptional regulator
MRSLTRQRFGVTIDAMTVFDQFGRIRKQLNRLTTHELRPFGMGPQQAQIMRYLAENNATSLGEMARALTMDPGAAARAIDALEKRCLVKRHASKKDQRRVEVSLTEAGMLLSYVVRDVLDRIATRFAELLSDDEQSTLCALQDKILDAVEIRD